MDKSPWTATLAEEKGLDLLRFKVQLSTQTHWVSLYLDHSTTYLKVNDDIVFSETLNLANSITSILNLVTVNEESISFVLTDDGRSFPAKLSFGVSVTKGTYKKIKLFVDGKLLLSK